MAKHRSTSRSRSGRPESGRSGGTAAGSRYDSDEYRSGYNREQDYERGGNGGSRSRVSYDYDDEYGGERRRSFVKRVGSKFSEMDLEKAMVLLHTALAVAIVIKQSRDRNRGRKGEPFRSAVSVLNHYLNEGGGLSDSQRATLEDIKEELRALYEREDEEMMSTSGR
jgi:Protein of unknown function (DUF3175)